MHHTREDVIRMGLTPCPLQPSQHRRANWADYAGPGLYMVTLCVDGRVPLFGHLEGDIRAPRSSNAFPHLVPSTLGRAILDNELPKIHAVYPEVELWQAALMPDHLHLLLYIRRPLPGKKRLGTVIGAFMGGCSRAWWRLSEPADTPAADAAGTTAVPAGTTAVPAGTTAVPAGTTAVPAVVPAASAEGNGRPLFEQGYHDRIIKRPGMLDTIKRYMADNPLRALMRRALPSLLERRLHLRIAGRDYAAFGCLFLLKRAEKEQVFYHRRDRQTGQPTELTPAFAQSRDRQLAEARQGVSSPPPSPRPSASSSTPPSTNPSPSSTSRRSPSPPTGSPSAAASRPAPAVRSSSSRPGASMTSSPPTTSASTTSTTSLPRSAPPPTPPSSASTTSSPK